MPTSSASLHSTLCCVALAVTFATQMHAGAIWSRTETWPCGIVPYKTTNMSEQDKEAFRTAAKRWQDVANATVRFVNVDDVNLPAEAIYLTVTNDPNLLKAVTYSAGYQRNVTLAADFSLRNHPTEKFRQQLAYDLVHELGHVLGFIHEHQRSDRPLHVFLDETTGSGSV
jgi:hypothetical protein